MKIRDYIKTANGNLRRSKMRTILTAGAIFVGAAILTLSLGLGKGAKDYLSLQLEGVKFNDTLFVMNGTEHNFNDLIEQEPPKYDPDESVQAVSTQTPLTPEDKIKMENMKNVVAVTPDYEFYPEYIQVEDEKYTGLVYTYYDFIEMPLAEGNFDNMGEGDIVFGYGFVRAMGYDDASELIGNDVVIKLRNLDGEIQDYNLKVSGVLENSIIQNTYVLIAQDKAAEMYEFVNPEAAQAGEYEGLYVTTEAGLSDDEIDELKTELKDNGYSPMDLDDFKASLQSIVDAAEKGLIGFSLIILFMSVFAIVNTLYMAVYERTREIGLMKALGMKGRGIFGLFAFEAMLIGFWGSVFGIAVASLLGFGVNTFAEARMSGALEGYVPFKLMPLEFALATLGIMLIAFISGSLPSRKAAKMDPIQALKYE